MAKTSITDPIWVSEIDHPDQPGKIGVSICVGNQQKWDTLVKERSGRNGSVVGLPEQVVVALSSG